MQFVEFVVDEDSQRHERLGGTQGFRFPVVCSDVNIAYSSTFGRVHSPGLLTNRLDGTVCGPRDFGGHTSGYSCCLHCEPQLKPSCRNLLIFHQHARVWARVNLIFLRAPWMRLRHRKSRCLNKSVFTPFPLKKVPAVALPVGATLMDQSVAANNLIRP